DRVGVMHLGQLAGLGAAERLYTRPRHPCTKALLNSIPGLDPETGQARRPGPLEGDPPSPVTSPRECRLRTRCPTAHAICAARMTCVQRLCPNSKVRMWTTGWLATSLTEWATTLDPTLVPHRAPGHPVHRMGKTRSNRFI